MFSHFSGGIEKSSEYSPIYTRIPVYTHMFLVVFFSFQNWR